MAASSSRPARDRGEDAAAYTELEARQNELHLAMGVVESMPASEAQTDAIIKLAKRMRLLVELRGKSEVGRDLDVADKDNTMPVLQSVNHATAEHKLPASAGLSQGPGEDG